MIDADDKTVNAALSAFTDPRGKAEIRFGLERIKQALAILGDPQNNLPPTIHIAGTNGKGSVAAFLREMGEAADLSVHVFTSPHLIRVNERIRLAGRLVANDELITALERVEDTGIDLTYFEALTAAAFLLFSQVTADLCIIETGAGGEHDSTNVMAKPEACIITSIGRDHEKLFGFSDITSIARTKAGIMRSGVPVVVAEQQENDAVQSLLEAAKDRNADVILAERDWQDGLDDNAFVFRDEDEQVNAPWLGLAGQHQRMNAGAACAALRQLNLPNVTAVTMAIGLREASWPARMQTLKSGPLQQAIRSRIIVDGAHNPAAAKAVAESISVQIEAGEEKPAMLMAMQNNKDADKIIGAFAPVVSSFVMTSLPADAGQEGGSSADPNELMKIAEMHKAKAQSASSLTAALTELAKLNSDTVYICGSLYLAGAILTLNNQAVE